MQLIKDIISGKKEINTIFVVAFMLFLSIFIILPPLFRYGFAKEEVNEDGDFSLSCMRFTASDRSNLVVTTNFEDNRAYNSLITFESADDGEELIAGLSNTSIVSQLAAVEKDVPADEKSILVVDSMEYKEFSITTADLKKYPDSVLADYLQNGDTLEDMLKKIGFECERHSINKSGL